MDSDHSSNPNEIATEIAYAKLNLSLHVRSRRNDGYHLIETIFAFADQGDILRVKPAQSLSLRLRGQFGAGLSSGHDNLVLRAAQQLQKAADVTQGAEIFLDKHLPIAAGIGGGSADAAAALRLLCRFWQIDPGTIDIYAIAAGLGADVPACVASKTSWGEGVGDVLRPIALPGLSGTPMLLVNPLKPCPTAPVFAAWDQVDRGALQPLDWINARNDLQNPACLVVPEISNILNILERQHDVMVARMSGSGATCFALFHSAMARDEAAQKIAASHPDWWIMAGAIR